MQIRSTDSKFPNMTDENLRIAAEMFIYLNKCPDPKDPLNDWIQFYDDLFGRKSPYQLILTLNRMIKRNMHANKKDIVVVEKLFKRASILFPLNYENIQSSLGIHGKFKNSSAISYQQDNNMNLERKGD